jgi:hypothetical protein
MPHKWKQKHQNDIVLNENTSGYKESQMGNQKLMTALEAIRVRLPETTHSSAVIHLHSMPSAQFQRCH